MVKYTYNYMYVFYYKIKCQLWSSKDVPLIFGPSQPTQKANHFLCKRLLNSLSPKLGRWLLLLFLVSVNTVMMQLSSALRKRKLLIILTIVFSPLQSPRASVLHKCCCSGYAYSSMDIFHGNLNSLTWIYVFFLT